MPLSATAWARSRTDGSRRAAASAKLAAASSSAAVGGDTSLARIAASSEIFIPGIAVTVPLAAAQDEGVFRDGVGADTVPPPRSTQSGSRPRSAQKRTCAAARADARPHPGRQPCTAAGTWPALPPQISLPVGPQNTRPLSCQRAPAATRCCLLGRNARSPATACAGIRSVLRDLGGLQVRDCLREPAVRPAGRRILVVVAREFSWW